MLRKAPRDSFTCVQVFWHYFVKSQHHHPHWIKLPSVRIQYQAAAFTHGKIYGITLIVICSITSPRTHTLAKLILCLNPREVLFNLRHRVVREV